jgi:hypothetical protein
MRIMPALFIAALLITGCKSVESATTTAKATSPVIEAIEKELPGSQLKHPLGHPLSPFYKDGSPKPAFDEATVQKLNGIVRRSKDAIDAFDKAAKANITLDKPELTKLATDAEKARTDFEAAAIQVRNSQAYYDKPILAGMAKFVSAVETELKEARDR